jgi:hypothetical protein
MAAYKVTDWSSSVGALNDVLTQLEVKLEALDSTNNPIVFIDVFQTGGAAYVAVLIYTIP